MSRFSSCGCCRPEHVRVHLGEAGHEILAAPVDALRIGWDSHRCARAERRDASIANDHGLAGEHAIAVHRQHGDVDEREGGGGGLRRMAGKKRRTERGQQENGSRGMDGPLSRG